MKIASRITHGILVVIAGLVATGARAQAVDPAPKPGKNTVVWKNPQERGVEGRGWSEGLARYYDRLPAKAQAKVNKSVWDFSRESSGMSVDFTTDSPEIRIRYKLLSDKLTHGWGDFSNQQGSGFDLYARAVPGALGPASWRWMGANKPMSVAGEDSLVAGMSPGKKRFRLYLPVYNGVESVEIGVRAGAFFEQETPRKTLPVVFYGTSIMQGGAASRPGLSMSAIIGRKLDVPIVNLGFCGCGRMEPEVAGLIAEIPAAAYVVDCVPNMDASSVKARTGPLVRILRAAHPETPILLVNYHDLPMPAEFASGAVARHKALQASLKNEYDKLAAAGVKNLHYLPGDALIGDDGEGTGDGVHPNALGHFRYAEAYIKALKPILAGSATAGKTE